MQVPFQYAFLVLTIPFLVTWAALFIFSKRTRGEQLVMSLVGIPLNVIADQIQFRDYWMPGSIASVNVLGIDLLLESVLYGFALGGIGSIIAEVLLHSRHRPRSGPREKSSITILMIAAAVVLISFVEGVNSVFALSFGYLLSMAIIQVRRPDLTRDSMFSGVFMSALIFVSYLVLRSIVANFDQLVSEIWELSGTQLGILISGVPLTELIWGFAWGSIAGPIYEFWTSRMLVTPQR